MHSADNTKMYKNASKFESKSKKKSNFQKI